MVILHRANRSSRVSDSTVCIGRPSKGQVHAAQQMASCEVCLPGADGKYPCSQTHGDRLDETQGCVAVTLALGIKKKLQHVQVEMSMPTYLCRATRLESSRHSTFIPRPSTDHTRLDLDYQQKLNSALQKD